MITNKQTLEDIIAARALIANELNWTQGQYAISKGGRPVELADPRACAFCADGALQRAVGINFERRDDDADRRYNAAYAALSMGTPGGIINFNDDAVSHDEVLGHFDKTITRLLAA